MTVIAFDGHTLAADSQTTWGTTILSLRTEKLFEYAPGKWVGLSGPTSRCAALKEWLCAGADPASRPEWTGSDEDHAVMLRWDGRRMWLSVHGYGPSAEVLCDKYAAIGSGADYALGAMYAGANAVGAVRAAIQCDTKCGGKIQSVTLRKRKGPRSAGRQG